RDEAVIPALVELARKAGSPEGRIHALWTLDGLGRLDPQLALEALGDSSEIVREHAIRLADHVDSEPIRRKLLGMGEDPDPRVVFQLACTLGRLPAAQSVEPLQRIAAHNLEDSWFQIAVLTSAADQSLRWFQAVTREKGFLAQPSKKKEEFLGRITAITGARQKDAEIAGIVRFVERGGGASAPWWRAASLNGLAEGMKRGAEKQPSLSGATEQSLFR